jgi:hypothetical protein
MELRQIDAGELNVGYGESGSSSGRSGFLLHGWLGRLSCDRDAFAQAILDVDTLS